MHLSADRRCHPLSFVLTPGQAADSPRFTAVLERIKVRGPVGRPRTRPDAVAADKTSGAVDLSSGDGELRGLGDGESGGFLVVGSFGEAVVQAAEHAIEEVALGSGVAVSAGPSTVVVSAGA